MSLADPQSITVAPAAAVSLPLTSREGDDTVYSNPDGSMKMTIAHQTTGKGRKRRTVRIDASKMAPDLLKPAENAYVSTAVYVVFDVPPAGYTPAELLALWQGFATQIRASSDLVVSKVLAGES